MKLEQTDSSSGGEFPHRFRYSFWEFCDKAAPSVFYEMNTVLTGHGNILIRLSNHILVSGW